MKANILPEIKLLQLVSFANISKFLSLKKNYKIIEVPISYKGRTYDNGKKITLFDGLIALVSLFKYRLFD